MVDSAVEAHRLRKLGLGLALGLVLGIAARYLLRSWARARSVASGEVPPQPGTGPRLPQILIPVANPDTAPGLIQLASALGNHTTPRELIALKIVTAPKGVPLEELRRYVLSMRETYEGALAQATSYAAEQGVPLSAELEVARRADAGILDYASRLPDLELILLGWRGPVSLRRVRRSNNQEVVSRARTNVGVLHVCQTGSLRRVLLPVGWGPHARLGMRLAERVARNTGAAVTVLRVLPMASEPDWEGERAALLKLLGEEAPGLRYDTELRLVREPAVVPAVLAETQRVPYDLVIVGASDEWWLRNWLFGAIPDQIARRAPCSVLLVRRYEPVPGRAPLPPGNVT